MQNRGSFFKIAPRIQTYNSKVRFMHEQIITLF